MKLNIISKRYWYFAFSLLLIIPGLILLAVKGMPLGIDFTGGTMIIDLSAKLLKLKPSPKESTEQLYYPATTT